MATVIFMVEILHDYFILVSHVLRVEYLYSVKKKKIHGISAFL